MGKLAKIDLVELKRLIDQGQKGIALARYFNVTYQAIYLARKKLKTLTVPDPEAMDPTELNNGYLLERMQSYDNGIETMKRMKLETECRVAKALHRSIPRGSSKRPLLWMPEKSGGPEPIEEEIQQDKLLISSLGKRIRMFQSILKRLDITRNVKQEAR